jgi:hypothetical protein
MKLKVFLSVALCSVLSGCNLPNFSEPTNETIKPVDTVANKISDATISINKTLSDLAEIEKNKRWQEQQVLHYNKAQPLNTTVERLVFKGNVETLLQTLTKNAGISFRIIGKPVSEVVVYIDQRQVDLKTLLEDIGTQIDNRADIKYRDYGSYKKLELIYSAR